MGFTVPDLEQATAFFVDVIGCEYMFELGPFVADDDWMEKHLNVHPRTVMRRLRFFRCKFGPNFEVFQYEAPNQNLTMPRNSDVGGHHLAFYVDDFDAAVGYICDALKCRRSRQNRLDEQLNLVRNLRDGISH